MKPMVIDRLETAVRSPIASRIQLLIAASVLFLPAVAAADLTLSNNTLSFQVSGSPLTPVPPLVAPPPSYVYLSATGNALSYATSATTPSNVRWIKVSPSSGTAPLAPASILLKIEIDLSVFSGQSALENYISANCPMTPGALGPTCNGTVTVSAPGVPARNIGISFTYALPVFCYAVSPNELTFTYQSGGTLPPAQVLNVFVPAGCPPPTGIAATALVQTPAGGNWLKATANGTTTAVSVTPTGLPPGDYVGLVSIRVGPGSLDSAVVLRVTPPPATNLVVPTIPIALSSNFGDTAPARTTLQLTSASGAPLAFNAAITGSPAITISPASGTTPAILTVTANPAGLSPGPLNTASITITAPAAANGPQVIPVSYAIIPPATCSGNLDPNPLVFNYFQGGALPSPQSLRLFTVPGCSQSSPATALVKTPAGGAWLSVSNNGGISVSISPGNLPPGEYLGAIFVVVGPALAESAVVLRVSAPALTVPSTPIDFSVAGGAATIASRSIPIGSTGGPLPFTAAITNIPGITLSATSGITPATLIVTSNAFGLTSGTYSGTLAITAPGASNSPQSIPISLNVQPPAAISVSQSTLNFTAQSGGTAPAAQQVQIGASGPPVAFTIPAAQLPSWLAISPAAGTTPAALQLTVNPAGLAPGAYSATFPVTPANPATASQSITVNLTVTAPLSASPSTLSFTAQSGAPAPAAQSLSVTGFPAGTTVTASPASNGGWLQLASTGPNSFAVSVNPAGLPAGSYSGTITISGPTPLTVLVTLTVTDRPILTASPAALNFAAGALTQSLRLTNTLSPVPFSITTSAPWLTISPASGTTPATITITASESALRPGITTGSLLVTATGAANSPLTVPVALSIGVPLIATGGIVNAASSPSTLIAPGSLFSIFGANLANATVLAATTPLPTALDGATVTVNGRPAPLVFVSPAQINAQMPYEIPPGGASVAVTANGLPSAPVTIDIQPTGPGIFLLQGTNHAVAQNQDFSINGPAAPAPPASIITAYLTGSGALDNPVPTGAVAPAQPLSRPLGAVSVSIGGAPATFYFAGLTPGLIGLMQLNVQIPTVPPGPQPMVVTIGGTRSNTALVTVGQ